MKTCLEHVDFVVSKWNGSRYPAIHVGALAYADDICFLTESIDDVECLLNRLESSAVEISHNKSTAMYIGQSTVIHVRFVNGEPVDSRDT